MKSDLRHWALIAYLLLTVFLLARPSARRLEERAADLDAVFASTRKEIAASALAKALDVPTAAVECHLFSATAKPSELVFVKLIQKKRGVAQAGADATQIIDSGMSINEAIDYFEDIQQRVINQIESAAPAVARREGNWFASALFGGGR